MRPASARARDAATASGRAWAVVTLSSVGLAACAAGVPEASDPAAVTIHPHVFETLDDSARVAAEFGRLSVPEVRGDPDAGRIELAFVRLPSTSDAPGPPIIYLAGGPGGSGIRDGSWTGEADYLDYRSLGDVIFLDQRGTGSSLPNLRCPVRWNLPLERAITRDDAIAVARRRSEECAAFWRARGVDLRGYTTTENADDIEDLRRALGYDRVRLVGGSYGSHLAFSVIRRHPESVDRAVIALVEGPDHTLKLPANIQAQLETIDSLVAMDPELSPLIPDFLGLMAAVLSRLEREPVTVMVEHPVHGDSVPITVGRFDLAWISAAAQGSGRFIREMPARYHQIAQGDFRWLGETAARFRTGWFWSAMTNHVDCASGATAARRRLIEEQARTTLLGDLADFPMPHHCAEWGRPDLGDAFRQPLQSDVPVLFMVGTLDGRTPLSNARDVESGFPNGSLMIVENLAHSFADSPELKARVQAHWMDFLAGARVPSVVLTREVDFALPSELRP